ncbi:MAG: hypothetical protein KGI54_05845 [Pseudomonadota bacterium]|nr:hypothetical protein [Pseudomonadota bacterium]
MRNFYVCVDLASPVIPTKGWLTLDAILGAQLFRETGDMEVAHENIPLAKTKGVWHGSAAFFDIGETGRAAFGRSMKLSDLLEGNWVPFGKTKYPYFVDQSRNQAANQWGAKLNTYPTLSSEHVYWFGKGDMEQVAKLFNGIREGWGIGKKVSHGYGRIQSVMIEECDIDRSFQLQDGSPARPIEYKHWISMTGKPDITTFIESWAMPYFCSERVLCAIPANHIMSCSQASDQV